MAYFTLEVKNLTSLLPQWEPEFGSYVESEVHEERRFWDKHVDEFQTRVTVAIDAETAQR